MIRYLVLLFSISVFFSCGSSNNKFKSDKKNKYSNLTKQLINYAKSFEGTPYLYGGNTSKGMDCSGLIHTAYKSVDFNIPRTSLAMYRDGAAVKVKHIKNGDLLFFKTSKKRSSKVNHVGLVTSIKKGEIYFIHSTSSKGVITSVLSNTYWSKAFVEAKRYL
ncbi:MAG: C40 family peptidase [Flavobacteriaceae bacterium]